MAQPTTFRLVTYCQLHHATVMYYHLLHHVTCHVTSLIMLYHLLCHVTCRVISLFMSCHLLCHVTCRVTSPVMSYHLLCHVTYCVMQPRGIYWILPHCYCLVNRYHLLAFSYNGNMLLNRELQFSGIMRLFQFHHAMNTIYYINVRVGMYYRQTTVTAVKTLQRSKNDHILMRLTFSLAEL